ncbi:mfs multidrug transporter-like protein [Diplodia corticola]|uniref:Mfs multidrug transporter-like protein n=1 Tax=Diplodia corticola TaxID=236234 RepID=A0A1J9R780_9PEZI|nr:mfs multidrug transporter-like protein [Diplodia corticola]OJD36385.1 mfs multidrug transporter-like protein [Diplodia corticola]
MGHQNGSRSSSVDDVEKADMRALEHTSTAATKESTTKPVRTVSEVPGNPNYYERDGLRTYGDGMDHDHEPPMTFKRCMALVAMAFIWVASQIPLYLFGAVLAVIYSDIGGSDIYVWSVVGNLIASAAVTPFVGPLSDLWGRRWLSVVGMIFILAGTLVASLAGNMNVFIVGMTFIGVGGAICELTALAATGELAPTKKRGIYMGSIIVTIIPFCPSVLWARWIAETSWRYNGLFCALWSVTGLVLLLVFYHPPPRVNSQGLSQWEAAKRIDYIGGFLSTAGIVLALTGLIWGGYKYSWNSAHVIGTLATGIVLMVGFAVWESFFAPWPMFPGRLKQDPRNLCLILLITFMSGANFFSVLVFWPIQSESMYDQDPIQIGIRSLPIGFGIIGGSVIVAALTSLLKGRIRTLTVLSCALMTAGTGAMVIARLDNLHEVYIGLTLAAVGIGGIIIPNQIVITIICPDDLIGSATAMAITVRMIGGCVGYAIYYSVFKKNFSKNAVKTIAPAAMKHGHIFDAAVIKNMAFDISANLNSNISTYPSLRDNPSGVAAIIEAGRQCFALSFPDIYWVGVGFGAASTMAAMFLGDISSYLDDHVAVTLS